MARCFVTKDFLKRIPFGESAAWNVKQEEKEYSAWNARMVLDPLHFGRIVNLNPDAAALAHTYATRQKE